MRQRNIQATIRSIPRSPASIRKTISFIRNPVKLLATCNVLFCFVQCWERICAKNRKREEEGKKKVVGESQQPRPNKDAGANQYPDP